MAEALEIRGDSVNAMLQLLWLLQLYNNYYCYGYFYNKYNSKPGQRQINPETGERWADPEVPDNISLVELETGPALDDRRIDALVAFLRTLTDRRYEHLIIDP